MSVEQFLWFLLGVLSAAALWLMLMPAFWRRAERLTTERLLRVLPTSLSEVAAGQDRLRAAHAVDQRRLEQEVERQRAAAQEAQQALGRKTFEIQDLAATIASQREGLEVAERDKTLLHARVSALEADVSRLGADRDVTRTRLSSSEIVREALEEKLGSLTELAEQRRMALDDAVGARDRAMIQLSEAEAAQMRLRQDLRSRLDEIRAGERRIREAESRASITEARLKASEAARATLDGLAQAGQEITEDAPPDAARLSEIGDASSHADTMPAAKPSPDPI